MKGAGLVTGNIFGLTGYIFMVNGFVKTSLIIFAVGAFAVCFVESLS